MLCKQLSYIIIMFNLCGIFHFYRWTTSIHPTLLFSHADYASWRLSVVFDYSFQFNTFNLCFVYNVIHLFKSLPCKAILPTNRHSTNTRQLYWYVYLFIWFKHIALEDIGGAVTSDVAPNLQVLGVMRHVEYPENNHTTYKTYIINWRDVKKKNVVNNLDMYSLRAPWQNGKIFVWLVLISKHNYWTVQYLTME